MVSQFCSGSSAFSFLKAPVQLTISRIIFSTFTTSAFVLFPISMAISQTVNISPAPLQTSTNKNQLLTQFPHHTSASSTLGFLVTNYSVYCQTSDFSAIDAITIKPLCGGAGEGEIAPQFKVNEAPIPIVSVISLEPVVLSQNDKVILLLSDL